MAESDLLEITSYLAPKARIANIYSFFRKKWVTKLISSIQINITSTTCLYHYFGCLTKHTQSTQKSKFVISFTISQESCKGESLFFACRQTSKLLTVWWYYFLMGMDKYVQSFKNNKFVISLKCFRKEVKASINTTNWFT